MKEVILLSKDKKHKSEKNIQAAQTVDFEINSDVVHSQTSHTANKPEPKYLKK